MQHLQLFPFQKKEKEGTDVVGNVIHCKNFKSRLTKENKMVDVLLRYDQGLNRYYGLLELAEKYDIIKKVSTRYEMPDGAKLYGKQILNDPEKYFTEELLNRIDEVADKNFLMEREMMPNLAPKIPKKKLKENWFRVVSNPDDPDDKNLCIQILEGPFCHVIVKYKNFCDKQ